MSYPVIFSIEIIAVSGVKIVKGCYEISTRCFDEKVVVVAHENIAMD